MSRKKLIKTEYEIFVRNINTLVDYAGNRTLFADAIRVSYDTVRSWCIGEFLPGGAQLLAIKQTFNVSIDWLLNGSEPRPVLTDVSPGISENRPEYGSEKELMSDWSEDTREACLALKEIMTSGDHLLKSAILSNLAAFKLSVHQKEEIRTLSTRLQYLEERETGERHIATGGAASSSTGKSKT